MRVIWTKVRGRIGRERLRDIMKSLGLARRSLDICFCGRCSGGCGEAVFDDREDWNWWNVGIRVKHRAMACPGVSPI